MKKNVAGQKVGCQLVSATDGSEFTGSVTIYVTGDAGTQAAGSVGAGACTHEGHGYHTYAPAQAETNYDLIACTFVGTGAVPATVQIYTSCPQTADAATVLGSPAGASVSADIAAAKVDTAAIKVKTDYLPSATAGAAGGVFIAGSNAATSITTALTANVTGNVTGNLSGSVGSVTGAVGSVTAGVTLAASAVQAIWDALVANLVTAGSIGKRIVDYLTGDAFARIGAAGAGLTAIGDARIANLDAAVSTRTKPADTQAAVTTVTTTTNLTNAPTAGDFTAAMKTSLNNATPTAGLSAAAVDLLWDEPIAGHLTGGTTGASLSGAGAAGDPWTATIPGAYGAGTAGKILGDRIDAAVTTRLASAGYTAPDNASVTAIKGKTDSLTFTSAGKVDATLNAAADLPAAVANKIADHTLRRSYANVRASGDGDAVGFRSLMGGLAKLVNKWSIAANTLTVTHEDDVTAIGTQAITTAPGAEPVSSLDTN